VPRRLLVTGSRTWTDEQVINTALAEVWHAWGRPVDPVLVVGRCPTGADEISERLWTARGFAVEPWPAQWRQHGEECPLWCIPRDTCALAGPRRDRQMVESRPDGVAGFLAPCDDADCRLARGGDHFSHGATGTVNHALKLGLPTRLYFATAGHALPELASIVVPGGSDSGVRIGPLGKAQDARLF
jgi:hypothetical protein